MEYTSADTTKRKLTDAIESVIGPLPYNTVSVDLKFSFDDDDMPRMVVTFYADHEKKTNYNYLKQGG